MPLFGLDRDVQIDQLHHTAWTADNAGIGEIRQIVQTSDGFLWLLTSDDRLLRFDGIRFEPIETAMAGLLPTGEHSWDDVFSLEAVPEGGLWIGHARSRVDLLKNGQVHTFSTQGCFPNEPIERMVQDHDGVLWMETARGLGRLQDSQCSSVGPGWGYSGGEPIAMLVDRGGTLWVKSQDGRLFFLRHGAKVFGINVSGSGDSKTDGASVLAQALDGSIWQASLSGIQRILQGRDDRPGIRPPILGPHADSMRILFDRDGALWFAMSDSLHRIPYPDRLVPWQPKGGEKDLTPSVKADGSSQTFTVDQGLSSNVIWDIFQDREGNIWTATSAGLDRFRNNAFIRAPLHPTRQAQLTFAAGERGTVWAAGWDGPVFNLGDRVLSTHSRDENTSALYRDPAGVIWVGTLGKSIWRSSGSGFVRAGWPPGEGETYVTAMSMDHAGGLWVSLATGGIFRLADGVWTRQNDRLGIPAGRSVYAIATDDHGRVWFNTGWVYVLDGDKVRKFDRANGIEKGYVTSMEVRGPHTWLGGVFGLALLTNNRFRVIKGVGGEVFRVTTGIIELSGGDLWINTASGVVRIPAAEVEKVVREPAYEVQFQRFDTLDGLDGKATYWIPVPTAIAGLDGKLWFSTNKGVFWVDPQKIARYRNLDPPPVHVEQITADHTTYDASSDVTSAAKRHLRLPPRVRQLEIDYTAVSFVAPEKVLFRYKLEGLDRDWQDAGNRRQAFFTNLAPGNHRFRVIACNNSGVWNEAGATLDFFVAPAYYQTNWFRSLCAVGFLALLWGAYQLRVRQLQRQFNVGLEARVNERTRIARELHDTLLQNFHGLMFQFQAASNLMLQRPDEAKKSLDDAIVETKNAITESRDAIQGLRSEPIAKGNLAELLASTSRELAEANANEHQPVFDLVEEGERRTLSPMVSNDICRIALELMRNAYQHAHARRIEAEIRYGDSMFRLRIRDDGQGIEPKVLKEGGRLGHWGLRGIRERADRIGARLEVWSEPGNGTEVQLLVPAAIAYETFHDSYRAKLVQKVKSRAKRS